MKLKIITQNNSETARTLAEELGVELVKTKSYSSQEEELLVCYGFWGELNCPNAEILNAPYAVQHNSNKPEALKKMKYDGVTVPELYTTPTFPCVGRTKRHKKGEGFWLCNSKTEYDIAKQQGADYFIQYIPVKTEYRVHVFDNEIIDIRKKCLSNNFEGTPNYIVRTLGNGWMFKECNHNHNIPPNILDMCKDAVASTGLTFGAVDLVLSDSNEWVVLEANSSPGISMENTKEAYKERIKNLLDSLQPEPEERMYTEQEIMRVFANVTRKTRKYGKDYALATEFFSELERA